jgi:hypothetical protein
MKEERIMRARFLSLALFALIVAAGLASISASAQQSFNTHGGGPAIHGVPPSVTSFGFGGRPGFHGVPPSVTSLNFGNVHSGNHQRPFNFRPHRNREFVSPFYGGYYYVPNDYYVMDPGVDDTMEEQYAQPGPTIFDSHGVGGRDYARPAPPPENDYRADLNRGREREPEQSMPQQPVANQPQTVLVFKDGHQQEVANYAIVGAILYDLSDGHTKKVGLGDLDLTATVKQNDDRGVDFKLPGTVKN